LQLPTQPDGVRVLDGLLDEALLGLATVHAQAVAADLLGHPAVTPPCPLVDFPTVRAGADIHPPGRQLGLTIVADPLRALLANDPRGVPVAWSGRLDLATLAASELKVALWCPEMVVRTDPKPDAHDMAVGQCRG